MKIVLLILIITNYSIFSFCSAVNIDQSDSTANNSKLIHWNKNIPLEIRNFEGAVKTGPFQAETSTRIECEVLPFKNHYYIKVNTLFDPQKSYFVRSEDDSLVLAHEQIHFDLTEIYARKFFKRLLGIKLDPRNLNQQLKPLFSSINQELAKKQEEYDSEVYDHPELEPKWQKWVEKELERLQEYSYKETVVEVN